MVWCGVEWSIGGVFRSLFFDFQILIYVGDYSYVDMLDSRRPVCTLCIDVLQSLMHHTDIMCLCSPGNVR